MEKAVAVRCQRIGCDAKFTDDDNPEGSCTYHDSGPIFHDGCKTGKHTTEKPITKAVSARPQQPVPPAVQNKPTDVNCSRCHQGFFCSDHGAKPRPSKPASISTMMPISLENDEVKDTPAPVKKIVGLDEPQICKNKGCGNTFKEKDNHETACKYHLGPAVFHDRKRGWKCCDVYVWEFDEFMQIPPCTKGWHNADAA